MIEALLKKLTYIAFGSLAVLPLLEENISSMTIIFTSIMVLINVFKLKIKKPPKETWILSIVFLIYFFRELFSLHPDFSLIILYLPFVIFPLIFYYKPSYINRVFLKKTLLIFQGAVIIKLVSYLVLFLRDNPVNTIFEVSKENIPYFRDYVFTHSEVVIHPTYFSSFLLISFTLSLVAVFKSKLKISILLNALNIFITLFFILLFNAKIIIVLVPVTIIFFFLSLNKRNRLKGGLFLLLFLLLFFFTPVKKGVIKRFNEIKTEVSKPIEGNYFNSTNIRIAILKCSLELTENLPIFGYGNSLQQKLDKCYESNNNSNFYKISTYNTHNFYLNILLYAGWGGLLLFLVVFFILFKKNKNNQLVLLLLIQVLIINLTENFFSRHYGIVVFSYLISMFIAIYNEEEKQVSRSIKI